VSFSKGRPLPGFFVRKQVKEHGTQSLVEGLVKGETIRGKRVVIVEDVTTTGGSSLKAAEAVKAEGGSVVCVMTIVDRLEGAGETFARAGIRFEPLLTVQDFR
jgi:orotate phosphoribosyltransferase